MFGGLFRPLHLLVILIVVLIVLGPGKLPFIGTGLGRGWRELKRAMSPSNTNQMRSGTNGIKAFVMAVLKLYYTVFPKK
ncbi:MAG: twin-arginine translocase TatA/TatE family subunit [Dissulfurispiraceae bacterium]